MFKNKLFSFLTITLFIFSFFCLSHSCFAEPIQDQTVRAEGQGIDSNAAKLDALRNAIAQVVGIYVQADTVVENYITTSDKIKTSVNGFVKNAKRLGSETKSGGTISAIYEVTVTIKPLQQDVKSVVGAEFGTVGHPSVCVVGWYESPDREEDEINKVAVTAMNRALIKKGYKVIDQWTIAELRQQDQAIVQAAKGVTKDTFDKLAAAIAAEVKADIFVTTYGSVDGAKAGVTTKMYSSYTAQLFGDDTGYGTVTSYDLVGQKKAIEDAVGDSMTEILSDVSKYWQEVITQGNEYILVLENYNDKERRKFKDILKNADGVKEVKQLNASGGHAEFNVSLSNISSTTFFNQLAKEAEIKGIKIRNSQAIVKNERAIYIVI